MATSAERMRALGGLEKFTIGISEDDLRLIAEHGYEGAASTDRISRRKPSPSSSPTCRCERKFNCARPFSGWSAVRDYPWRPQGMVSNDEDLRLAIEKAISLSSNIVRFPDRIGKDDKSRCHKTRGCHVQKSFAKNAVLCSK